MFLQLNWHESILTRLSNTILNTLHLLKTKENFYKPKHQYIDEADMEKIPVIADKYILRQYLNNGTNMHAQDMAQFELYIEEIYTKREEEESENGLSVCTNAVESSIVFSKLYSTTPKGSTINLLLGNFDGKISNLPNYQEALKQAIEKEIKFNVILLTPPVNEHSKANEQLVEYQNQHGDKVNFYSCNVSSHKEKATAILKKYFPDSREDVHFATFGTEACRIESIPNEYLAHNYFHNIEVTKLLNSIFKEILDIFNSESEA